MSDEDLLMDYLMETQKINPTANSNLHYTILYLKGEEFMVKKDWELNQEDPNKGFVEYNYANNYQFDGENLVELYLGSMNLERIPESIKMFKNLNKLNVSHNKLTSLPETLSQLKQLRYFHFNNNNISEFPMTIFDLSGLNEIHCQENQISVIPEQITNYIPLQYLDIRGNSLDSIPNELLSNHDIKLRSRFRDDLEE